jgi:enoyl-CoA hydratase/carnithine racemase
LGELVEVRRDGDVCVVTLRREAKLNAISAAVERELGEALAGDAVLGSRCVVLTGGDRVFSAGADVTEFRGRGAADVLAGARATGSVFERVAELRQPTIAAIAGYCLGGGLELALAADFRVADETAVFGFPEVGIGILPSWGGTVRATRLLGPARARELVLLRDRVDAAQALALGLVTEVVPAGGALPRALEHAGRLAALPPLAVAVAKEALDRIAEAPHAAGLTIERLAYAALTGTTDAQDAATAFTEKRRG